MNDYFTLNNIKRLSDTASIKSDFGIEREGLRVQPDGNLSRTPHPAIFGNKLTNTHITTDFSESQLELITPIYESVDEVYNNLLNLTVFVNSSLDEGEYLWYNSLPCILPPEDEIPIARYEGADDAKKAMDYRKKLAKKYGTQKQMISGIHYNYSLSEDTVKSLYIITNPKIDYKQFKDMLYLKLVRNYLRYSWLIIYLLGCSVGAHSTFTTECIENMENSTSNDTFYTNNGASYRNASWGYRNLVKILPDYGCVESFVHDIEKCVENGTLSEPKEFYSSIRLKAKENNEKILDSLKEDGIKYLEIRTIDINPFDICAITRNDLSFLEIFMIYLLIKEEDDYENWQDESMTNEITIAEKAFEEDLELIKNGEKIKFKTWAMDILNEIKELNNYLTLNKDDIIDDVMEKINDSSKTYAKQLVKLMKDDNFIDVILNISKQYKAESQID